MSVPKASSVSFEDLSCSSSFVDWAAEEAAAAAEAQAAAAAAARANPRGDDKKATDGNPLGRRGDVGDDSLLRLGQHDQLLSPHDADDDAPAARTAASAPQRCPARLAVPLAPTPEGVSAPSLLQAAAAASAGRSSGDATPTDVRTPEPSGASFRPDCSGEHGCEPATQVTQRLLHSADDGRYHWVDGDDDDDDDDDGAERRVRSATGVAHHHHVDPYPAGGGRQTAAARDCSGGEGGRLTEAANAVMMGARVVGDADAARLPQAALPFPVSSAACTNNNNDNNNDGGAFTSSNSSPTDGDTANASRHPIDSTAAPCRTQQNHSQDSTSSSSSSTPFSSSSTSSSSSASSQAAVAPAMEESTSTTSPCAGLSFRAELRQRWEKLSPLRQEAVAPTAALLLAVVGFVLVEVLAYRRLAALVIVARDTSTQPPPLPTTTPSSSSSSSSSSFSTIGGAAYRASPFAIRILWLMCPNGLLFRLIRIARLRQEDKESSLKEEAGLDSRGASTDGKMEDSSESSRLSSLSVADRVVRIMLSCAARLTLMCVNAAFLLAQHLLENVCGEQTVLGEYIAFAAWLVHRAVVKPASSLLFPGAVGNKS